MTIRYYYGNNVIRKKLSNFNHFIKIIIANSNEICDNHLGNQESKLFKYTKLLDYLVFRHFSTSI
jgi:hypothetical protein